MWTNICWLYRTGCPSWRGESASLRRITVQTFSTVGWVPCHFSISRLQVILFCCFFENTSKIEIGSRFIRKDDQKRRKRNISPKDVRVKATILPGSILHLIKPLLEIKSEDREGRGGTSCFRAGRHSLLRETRKKKRHVLIVGDAALLERGERGSAHLHPAQTHAQAGRAGGHVTPDHLCSAWSHEAKLEPMRSR